MLTSWQVHRSLLLSVYLPSSMMSYCQSSLLLVIPLYALDLGASPGLTALIFSLRGLGNMVADLPAGYITIRLGPKITMLLGLALMSAAASVGMLINSSLHLGLFSFVAGSAMALWLLARLTLIGDNIPNDHRGKALSSLGGIQRMAGLFGPVSTGFIALAYGFSTVLMVIAIISGCALILLFFTLEKTKPNKQAANANTNNEPSSTDLKKLKLLLLDHQGIFKTAGLAVLLLTVVRSARLLLIPLWGAHIALDPSAIGLVVSFAGLIDTCMFPLAGYLMDRFGRKYAAVPCLLLLSCSLLLMPLSQTALQLSLIAVLAGLGNGLGSGVTMTLGTDLAPPTERAPFLSVWRLLNDTGSFSGPVLIGLITAATTLAGAFVTSALLGLTGLYVMTFLVKETLQRSNES
jgi:MFS family permease